MSRRYQVHITPLEHDNEYGNPIDVTNYVKNTGVSTIKRELDSGDFDTGVFVLNSVKLKCNNDNGYLNDETDYRSIFQFKRDLAKVDIVYFDKDENITSSFGGLIEEKATRADVMKDEIEFVVMSKDSILTNTKVTSGQISSGSTIKSAILNILNDSKITSVLVVDPGTINPDLNYTIDDGSVFDGMTCQKALSDLMIGSNSVLYIDKSTDKVIVRNREENSGKVFNFYGPHDPHGRCNIDGLEKYNTGKSRMFNCVEVNGMSAEDIALITTYGYNKKSLNLDFITDPVKKKQLAERILREFSFPKLEFELTTSVEVAKQIDYLDLISVDFGHSIKPARNKSLPSYQVAKYGAATYPKATGSIKINPNMAFKVISIKEKADKQSVTLKLRQRGISIDDGIFAATGTYYGSAIYGKSQYQDNPDSVDPSENSVYGAGEYGTVKYK